MKQEITWIKNDGREVPIGIFVLVIYHLINGEKVVLSGYFYLKHANYGVKASLNYDYTDYFQIIPSEVAFSHVLTTSIFDTRMLLPARNVIAWTELPEVPKFA